MSLKEEENGNNSQDITMNEDRVKQINNEYNNANSDDNNNKHKFSIRDMKDPKDHEIKFNELSTSTDPYSELCAQNNLLHTHQCDHKHEEIVERVSNTAATLEVNTTKTYKEDTSKLSLDYIVSSSIKLIKTNEEFCFLVILLIIWLCLIFFEFMYGMLRTQGYIISDSFFNYFKTFSFLIAGAAILLTRVSIFKSVFQKNRIELIAALSNCVFLIIVSMYMFLEALHMITEPNDEGTHSESINQEEQDTIYFFKNFFIVKVIVGVVGMLVFSDYIVHPSIQIKLLLWKKQRIWKDLKDLSLENLKECRSLIRNWNNHYENMNALAVNILSDLITSVLFLICFFASKDRHFEGVYFLISIVNIIVLVVLLTPLMKSIIKILMQGRSELYECFYNKLHQEVSYFDGCLGIKEMKFWMTAQNDLKCLLRLYVNSDLKLNKLKEHIHSIVNNLEISFEMTLELTN